MSIKPLRIFDYIFYRIALYYERNSGYEKSFVAILLLSLIQSLNVLAIWNIGSVLSNGAYNLSTNFILLLCYVILTGLNAIRYKRVVTYEGLAGKWVEEKPKQRKRGGLILFYFILSVLFYVFSGNL